VKRFCKAGFRISAQLAQGPALRSA